MILLIFFLSSFIYPAVMQKDIIIFHEGNKIGTITNNTDDLVYIMKHISYDQYDMTICDKEGNTWYVTVNR